MSRELHAGEIEEQEAWPAFVDLFAATSLLFIAMVGVFFYLLIFQQGQRDTSRQQILTRLGQSSANGTLFTIDSTERQFVRIVLKERATFPHGKYQWAFLRDSGKIALRVIAQELRKDDLEHLYRELRVMGHSDSDPYPGTGFSNWELSASRAAVVARYLVDEAMVNPCKVSATGFGPYHPISARAEENRRIEIQIVPALQNDTASFSGSRGCSRDGDRRSPLAPVAQR